MTNTTIITALPIGEIDTDVIRSEFESIVGVFKDLRIDNQPMFPELLNR